MNIARVLGRKHVLTSLACLALSAIGIQFALTPKRIVVHPDARWSTTIKKALKQTIEKKPVRTFGATQLRDSLIQEYPSLKDVEIRYSGSLEAVVRLTGWNPLILLCSSLPGNKVYVVCEKGLVLEKNTFTTESLSGLPTIMVEGTDFEEKRTAEELIDMAVQLSPTLFDIYDVIWESKTTIRIKDKVRPILITADFASIHDAERFAYVQRIYDSEKQYTKGMKADIRLKDSLVCSPARI